MTYTDIYGVSIKDYCKAQGITLDDLIKRVEIDLQLLNDSFKRNIQGALPDYELTSVIADHIHKKQQHLKRLKRIANGDVREHREP